MPSAAALWLLFATPMKTVGCIAIVSDPTTVHVAPSPDQDAVITSPSRAIFTHAGAASSGPVVLVLTPFAVTLRWNASPFPELTSIRPCAEPGVRSLRIITPTLCQTCVADSDATRATISPSPVSR